MITVVAQSEAAQIGQLIVEGLVVSIGVTLCFSVALVATMRTADARREGQALPLAAWLLLAALGFAAFAGFVVLGVVVVADK